MEAIDTQIKQLKKELQKGETREKAYVETVVKKLESQLEKNYTSIYADLT